MIRKFVQAFGEWSLLTSALHLEMLSPNRRTPFQVGRDLS
jgi:hypothetical protein